MLKMSWRSQEPDAKPKSHRENQYREEKTQLLGAKLLACRSARLCADHASHHQKDGEHNVDRLIGRCLQDCGDRAHENDLEQ